MHSEFISDKVIYFFGENSWKGHFFQTFCHKQMFRAWNLVFNDKVEILLCSNVCQMNTNKIKSEWKWPKNPSNITLSTFD